MAARQTRTLLGPLEIQKKEFRVSSFNGYKMRDVDEFLDAVTDSMSALVAEVDRLRTGAPAPVVGAPDLDDVSRQADEIIERARAEAARIVAEAKVQTPGVTSTPRIMAAVNAFLTNEREFLQSLAGLVQGHAESVKGMSKARGRRRLLRRQPRRGRSGGGRAQQGRAHQGRAGQVLRTGVRARREAARHPRSPPCRRRRGLRCRPGCRSLSSRSGLENRSRRPWRDRTGRMTAPPTGIGRFAICSGARTDELDQVPPRAAPDLRGRMVATSRCASWRRGSLQRWPC